MAIAMFEQPLIYFPMHRRNSRHKKICLFVWFSIFFLLGDIAHRILPQQKELHFFSFFDSCLPQTLFVTCLLGLISILLLAWLLRARYFVIDRIIGMLYYSQPIIGQKAYYFVEVKQIECEVDMSQVLLRLNSKELHRVFLRLHNNKLLLIAEEYSKEASEQLCQQLRSIFQVEIQHVQSVNQQRDREMHLGNYIIQKELSHGGMGKVFLAEDSHTKQQVALKVLPANLAKNHENVVNFTHEAQVLQRLNHAGVVRILYVGHDKDTSGNEIHFFAMEYIEGRPVSALIKTQELTIEQSILITLQVAFILDYIHRNGVIHRDIKPSNVMLKNSGQCVLIDFGIARESILRHNENYHYTNKDSETENTGTLPYMSPEQLTPGARVDRRTDLYSLGIMLYELLTYKRPFTGSDSLVCNQILGSQPNPPSAYNPKILPDLDTITMSAISKAPRTRYQTGAAFASDLHHFLRGEPITMGYSHGVLGFCWRVLKKIFGWLWVSK